MARTGWVIRLGGDVGRDPEQAVGGRARLAHEHIAFFALEPGEARRLLPFNMYGALHQAPAAGPAGTSRAFVGNGEATRQGCVKDSLRGCAIEAEFAAFGLKRYLHR